MERGAERIDVISMHGAIKRARKRKCHSPLKKVLRESDSHLALHIPMVETLRRSLSTGGMWIHILTLVFLYKQSYTLPGSPSLCYIVCLTTFSESVLSFGVLISGLDFSFACTLYSLYQLCDQRMCPHYIW